MNTFRVLLNYAQDPVLLLVVTLVFGVLWRAYDVAADLAGEVVDLVARRLAARERRRTNALHEHYQITYRIGSPPSHRAAGARP